MPQANVPIAVPSAARVESLVRRPAPPLTSFNFVLTTSLGPSNFHCHAGFARARPRDRGRRNRRRPEGIPGAPPARAAPPTPICHCRALATARGPRICTRLTSLSVVKPRQAADAAGALEFFEKALQLPGNGVMRIKGKPRDLSIGAGGSGIRRPSSGAPSHPRGGAFTHC